MRKNLLILALLASSATLMAQTARISKIVGITPNTDGLPADTAIQQFTYSPDGKISEVEYSFEEHTSEGVNTTTAHISYTYSDNTISAKAQVVATEDGGMTNSSTQNMLYTLTNGLITSETLTGSDDDGTYKYTYDSDNRLKTITYHADGDDDETTTVTWNNGNITGMVQSSEGIDLQHYIYTYADTVGNEQIRAFETPLGDLTNFDLISPLFMASMGYYGQVSKNILRTSEIRTIYEGTEYEGDVYDYTYKFSGDHIKQISTDGTISEITWTDETNGIEHTTTLKGSKTEIFGLNGMRLNRLHPGINIVSQKDGSTKKVIF